jgi:hypothetical protein
MKVVTLRKGIKFQVDALVLNDGICPSMLFLEKLKMDEPSSHRSLLNIINLHADYGPILNEQKSRDIHGFPGIFEFKTKKGARLLYFYLPDKITVIVDGFKKGEPAKNEYQKAFNLMIAYKKEVDHE